MRTADLYREPLIEWCCQPTGSIMRRGYTAALGEREQSGETSLIDPEETHVSDRKEEMT